MIALRMAVGLAIAGCMAAGAARAQDPAVASDDLRARQAALYEAMLDAPDDLDIMFRHALASVEISDYEAAITTLERMLIFNPNLGRAKVELGAAYFRLGAYENARYYFEDVLANDDPPPEVARRIDAFLTEIDKRTQKSGFAGVATFGATYSSNANLGPPDGDVLLFGRPAILGKQFVETDDFGFRATAQGRHFYDLDRPNSDVWLTDVSLFSLHYLEETDGDLDSFAFLTGPRLSLNAERFGPKIRPYLSGEALRSGNELLYYGAGLGAEYSDTLNDRVNLFAAAEGKWREYDEQNDFDGPSFRAAIGASYAPDPSTAFSALAFAESDQADKDYNTNYEAGFRLGAVHRYDSGVEFTDRLWSVAAFASASWRWFDEPDPVVDPNRKRDDLDLRAGISHVFHLTEGWFVQADADYLYRDSNVSNFDLENFGVGLSVGLSF
ncbi:hypothetical protein G5B40_20190 [Pikeienuella piscinae]|uniref:Tetratricopeptide repeat protein n=1 Tax=Pikeienuella piscinae TaxID=2748098 RepID=A0A7M3T6D2_9RHOB|nr:hypothetical protein [Pikeienuella piscinae]QIE57563.1 hypothetical protein G5B40_20190 [Pikeienuella piscinae]